MVNDYEMILIDWVKGANSSASINLDTDLIESAVLDSMQFMDLILFVEEIANREIDLDEQIAENFKNLRTIIDVFLRNHSESTTTD